MWPGGRDVREERICTLPTGKPAPEDRERPAAGGDVFMTAGGIGADVAVTWRIRVRVDGWGSSVLSTVKTAVITAG